MATPLSLQSLPTLLGLTLIAGVVSSSIYFLFRFFEKRSKTLVVIISLFLSPYLLRGIISMNPLSDFAFGYFIAAIFIGAGSFFHKKSSRKSTHFVLAFALMLVVVQSSFIANCLLMKLSISPFESVYGGLFGYSRGADLAWALMSTQCITPPFLLWVWKSSRLRSGIDKHFDS